ncbi:hypothetical protein [Frondihabitans cladoniiphilus]|uniref:Pilus assembly protein PilO n=1 Tax=Frondihabitans cladoniiphilus TaxID=715785 RepID=A0ABP8VYG5_9MICO
MDRNRLMMFGAGLATVVVVVVGFLLGVQPQLQTASQAKDAAVTVSTQNATLAGEIVTLKSRYAAMDSLNTQLGLLTASVPADVDAGSFITEINGIAQSTAASVTTITTGTPLAYLAPVVTSTAPAATSTATSSASPSASATAAPAPAASAATPVAPVVTTDPTITAANFSTIPVSITISATNEQALTFLKELRTGQRLYLVTGITSTAGSASSSGGAAASSTPTTDASTDASATATAATDTRPVWTITGLIYALSGNASTTTTTPTATSGASTGTTTTSTDTAAGK